MVSIIIPVYNASGVLSDLLKAIREQTIDYELILIDSESDYPTQKIYREENVQVVRIKKAEFNHGTTRNLGVKLATSDTLIFMTQDALPASSTSVQALVNMLYSDQTIAMAYGRQLPYPEASIFGHFARLNNYPVDSKIKTKALIPVMGIKTCSCSNSFAAYRKADLLAVGGFPEDTILGEDVSVAARFILAGKSVAYCAEAEVYHSHDYTLVEEFKRYFDIGVFHSEQRSVLAEFTKAESEGLKYVVKEWQYLKQHGHLDLIPAQVIRTIIKYAGYKLGSWEGHLPTWLKRQISMHTSFWK